MPDLRGSNCIIKLMSFKFDKKTTLVILPPAAELYFRKKNQAVACVLMSAKSFPLSTN